MSQSQRFRRRESLPTEIGEYLADTSIGALAKRASALTQLQAALWSVLPEKLRDHCDLANLRRGSLVAVADSPLWAAQLRNHQGLLQKRAEQLNLPIKRVEVRVVPSHQRTPKTPVKRHLSDASRQYLQGIAEQTPDNDLRAILTRIAKRRT